MPVITLTSDWINNDYYLAAVKAQLIKKKPDLSIIDLNHSIRSFHVPQAAFVIRNAYSHFPVGSVHLIYINAEQTEENPFIAVRADGHYFIGADNGIFSLILNEKKAEIVKLGDRKDEESTFGGLYTFTDAAVSLLSGEDFFSLGERRESYNESFPLRAAIEENFITGSIIYVDSYGNVVTNITREIFDRVGRKQGFEIFVQSKHYMISTISKSYSEVPQGELVAVFNSANLLEIAINRGNASRLLNLNFNSSIRVEFSG